MEKQLIRPINLLETNRSSFSGFDALRLNPPAGGTRGIPLYILPRPDIGMPVGLI